MLAIALRASRRARGTWTELRPDPAGDLAALPAARRADRGRHHLRPVQGRRGAAGRARAVRAARGLAHHGPQGAGRADRARPGHLAPGLGQLRRHPAGAAAGPPVQLQRGHARARPPARLRLGRARRVRALARGGDRPGAGQRRARVARFVRVRLADDEPLAVERAAIAARDLPDPGAGRELALRRPAGRGASSRSARCSICARPRSTPRTRGHLGIPPGSPVMATVRHGYLADGRPVEFTRSVYRGDRYDFVAEMRRG